MLSQSRFRKPQLVQTLVLFSPVLVGVLIMLPRLVSPQFGLFDDGTTLLRAREITSGVWKLSADLEAGRFRPVYWLFYALIYGLFGKQPGWFFMANTLLMAWITAALVALVLVLGGSRRQAWLAGMLFVLSGPIIENFYTLSKPEALQLALMLTSLLLISRFGCVHKTWQKAGLGLAAAASIFVAGLTKETTLLVFPISAAWLAAAWLRRKQLSKSAGWIERAAFCLVALVGTGVYLAMKFLVNSGGLTGGSYTNGYVISLGQMLSTVAGWGGWLVRDFTYVLPLVFLVSGWAITRRRLLQASVLIDSFLWMAGWVAIYLPWSFVVEYYLLPFAAGCAVFSGVLLDQALVLLAVPKRGWQYLTGGVIIVASLLFFASLANNYTNARIQLAVDAANAEVLDVTAAQALPGSTVLVNIQYINEYVPQVRAHLHEVRGREDLSVDLFKFQPIDRNEPGLEEQYILSPHIENQPALTVRLGQVEETQVQWNKLLTETLDENWQVLFHNDRQVQLINIDLPRLLCPFFRATGYCASARPFIDRRTFSYGWTIYQLELP